MTQNRQSQSKIINGMRGVLTARVYNEKNELLRTYKASNFIVDSGATEVMKWMSGDPESALEGITDLSIGKGTTPTVSNDTAMESPSLDNVKKVSSTYTSSRAIYRFLTNNAVLRNDSYTEFGFFINETMFSRVVKATPIVKSEGESIVWEYVITLTVN